MQLPWGEKLFLLEFPLLLLPQIDLPGALAVAKKARKALKLHYHEKPLPPLTASSGVACAPQHGMTPSQLLEAVDAALFRAKQLGCNRVEQANDCTFSDGKEVGFDPPSLPHHQAYGAVPRQLPKASNLIVESPCQGGNRSPRHFSAGTPF